MRNYLLFVKLTFKFENNYLKLKNKNYSNMQYNLFIILTSKAIYINGIYLYVTKRWIKK